ncbi:acyl-CoA thioesterase [Thalassobacillus pellis]|uniref:acyl-CoA thioesterase n=1 Tax=Thalassobacillus pellis TaxID=748008 RepID=UPI0019606C80|nr:thioesterase family protein [Thalassobacillus pellis]MBM7555034.1 acyl-CoA thioester hydrolase [Thalassobacillus pellis]
MKKISYITDWEDWKKGFNFSIPIHIRFSETDLFGHMNNTSPFIYFEEARISFMKEKALFDLKGVKSSSIPVVGDLQCDFLRQLHFDDKVNLYVKACHIGSTSFDLHYLALTDNQEAALTGRGRIVQIDRYSGKPQALSDEMKAKLTEN